MYSKFWTALAAALTVAGSLAPGGFTAGEGLTVLVSALGAVGVYLVPNAYRSDPMPTVRNP